VFKRSEQTDQTRYVEQINRWFTAITLLISIGSFAYWAPIDITRAMNAATAVLIIACPCALLLAATFTHGNMLRILGLNGFYLRSAQVIERLTEIKGIVFDKTGTLTHSKRSRLEWHGQQISEAQQAWMHALSIQSIHPYSRLLSRFWTSPQRYPVQAFHEIPGQGLAGEVAGHQLRIGNANFVGATEVPMDHHAGLWISIDGMVLGYFSVKQAYRESLAEVIASLRNSFKMAVLSGDREGEAPRLRSLFGDQVPLWFNQTPEQKMLAIQELQSDQTRWMMIGDGLNDAGALAQSHVGVSVTDDLNRFSPACDAILDGSKLDRLQTFINYVTNGKHMVTLAFGISLIYNVIGLAYAVHGQLSPVIAAILMPLMSISIVSITTLSTTWLAYRSGLRIQSPIAWEASV
jgi:Cu+-exporting ATPase